MRCGHRHLIIHRNDIEDHRMPEDGPEGACSCGPAIMCPVCDWQLFNDECFIVAPGDVIDAHLVVPPKNQLN